MKMAEATAESGLSADTIRFYEHQGLLGKIRRGPDGHRVFSPQDLRWLKLFERLRSTDMPLAEMKCFADLAREGDGTRLLRLEMLKQHLVRLNDMQQRIDNCRALINEKISAYSADDEELANSHAK